MNIFFDLDGTLLDSRYRLYRLFQDLVPQSTMEFEEYWLLKKDGVSNLNILKEFFKYSETELKSFLQAWMSLIETSQYLELDQPIEGVEDVLANLATDYELYVCTSRQFKSATLEQLMHHGLSPFFKDVMVTEQKLKKEALIKAACKNLGANDWLIGDTGRDIQVGHALKINTCAVETGFLSRKKLKEYHPDFIVNSVREILTVLKPRKVEVR